MGITTYDPTTDEQIRCPTCKAKQAWSDTCRRCRCDLTLLRTAAEASRGYRRRCLLLLRAGRHGEALRHARRSLHLRAPPLATARACGRCR